MWYYRVVSSGVESLGFKNAIIFGIIGLVIGIILVAYIISQIGSSLTPETRWIWEVVVPILFMIAGLSSGYKLD